MNRFSKELKKISAKRGKTDADFEELARVAWYASLYLDEGRICIPSEVLESAFVNGAKKQKLGKQTQAGLFVVDNAILNFDGCGMTVDELWERDENRLTKGVRVGTAKVMRTRFWAKQWNANIEVAYDESLLNPAQVKDIIKITGEIVGICDWRPKFGRFKSEDI